MSGLEKQYDAVAAEAKWYRWWMDQGLFHNDSRSPGEPYCIMIPPPNVTGILHMGHALNNTVQDILIRRRRMEGRNTVWLPGTDHAGIATQNVVERALRKEGKDRHALGREAFVERVWKWRDEYGATIINQLKRLGSACDWERERFTMDAGLSRAVEEVFVRLFEKGLIYRANYITNWCPRCQTALSDEESEHVDTAGKLYHIRYPFKGDPSGAGVVVATTRPETMLGDVAVAVSPRDARYQGVRDRLLILPLLNRELPIIADDFVDPAFGTGAVKVTPAHDPNDFDMGRRHQLTPIDVMHPDGRMNEAAGPYAGLDRMACRKKVVADLEAGGYLVKIDDHQHAVGHCYRCDTVVEPRLSLQWFVKMKPLAEPALRAVQEGTVRFIPDRWTKVYTEWMENIRDWCISRQIWWGHRIPVFYCDDPKCGHFWAARGGLPAACPKCGGTTLHQDADVLDTWFSSWLWPFSTFGWPEMNADLKCYYPSHTLVTASEIIFFWVARMIMAGYEFMGAAPFGEVYIHGTVRDERGRKMSKSLGNSIDPLTIIDQYGTDALRFSLMMITATGQDVFLSNDKFEIGRNFATKIWNAARYLQMQNESAGFTPTAGEPVLDPALLSSDDRHLLQVLHQAIADTTQALDRFRFNDAAHAIYEFIWHQYCDWYVEFSKEILYGTDAVRKTQVLGVMHYAFAQALKLLHPFMPFLTEELWHGLGYGAADDSILRGPWPQALDAAELARRWGCSPEERAYVEAKQDLIRVGRTLRADYGISPAQKIDYILKPLTPELAERLRTDEAGVRNLLRASTLRIECDFTPGQAMPGGLNNQLGAIYMPVQGLIDVQAETARLMTQVEKIRADVSRIQAKLDNVDFVAKAPETVVEQQRAKRRELAETAEKLTHLLEMLKG